MRIRSNIVSYHYVKIEFRKKDWVAKHYAHILRLAKLLEGTVGNQYDPDWATSWPFTQVFIFEDWSSALNFQEKSRAYEKLLC